MTGENDRVIGTKIPDQISDLDNLLRIESRSRLIQNDNLWIPHQGLCNPDPLFISFGQVLHQPVCHILHSGLFHDIQYVHRDLALRNFLCSGYKCEILPWSAVQIQRRLFRKISDTALGLFCILENVISVDMYFSLSCSKTAGKYIHRCAFPCSVRSQQTSHLPAVQLCVQS